MRRLVQGIIAAVTLVTAMPANAGVLWATFWGSTDFNSAQQALQIQFYVEDGSPNGGEGAYEMFYNGWQLEGSGSDIGRFSLTNDSSGTSFQIYSTENQYGQAYTGGFFTPLTFSLDDIENNPIELIAGRGANIYLDYYLRLSDDIQHYGSLAAEKVTLSATSPIPLTNVPPVPEPSTWAMMILGLGVLGVGLRRRRGLYLRHV